MSATDIFARMYVRGQNAVWKDAGLIRAAGDGDGGTGGGGLDGIVSVLDFGATGDGTSNDQPGIQAALDSAYSTVFLPPGRVYRIASQIKIPKGKKLVGVNTGSGPRWASAYFDATTASGSNVLTNVTGPYQFNGIVPGGRLGGTGIPAGATVTAVDRTARTVTMSANATASGNQTWLYVSGPWQLDRIGSVIAVAYGTGSTAVANAAVLMNSFTTLQGVQIWHQNQPVTNGTQHPPAIALNPAGDPEEGHGFLMQPEIRDVVITNPWIGIDATVAHGVLTIDSVLMSAWNTGVKVDHSWDVDRLINIQMSPNFQFRGPWGGNVWNVIQGDPTARGFAIGACDQLRMSRCFANGYYTCLYIGTLTTGRPNGIYVEQCGFESSPRPVYIQQPTNGVVLSGCACGTDGWGEESAAGTPNAASYEVHAAANVNELPDIVFSDCGSFYSQGPAFRITNTNGVRINGCYAYAACSWDPGSGNVPALDFSGCNGVLVNQAVVRAGRTGQTASPRASYVRLSNVNGYLLTDCRYSGASAANGFTIQNCTSGAMTNALVAGAATGIASSGNTGVSNTPILSVGGP